jgi:hypothetical protein
MFFPVPDRVNRKAGFDREPDRSKRSSGDEKSTTRVADSASRGIYGRPWRMDVPWEDVASSLLGSTHRFAVLWVSCLNSRGLALLAPRLSFWPCRSLIVLSCRRKYSHIYLLTHAHSTHDSPQGLNPYTYAADFVGRLSTSLKN